MGRTSSPSQPEYFNSQERVRLTFLLKDLFPIPQTGFSGDILCGWEWYFLYENLQRTLGRKEIGSGFEVVSAMEDFVTRRATDEELLTMLELIPKTYLKAFERSKSHPYQQPSTDQLRRIMLAINAFLEKIGSPARFTERGKFVRDGFVDTTPPALKALHGREQLRSDIQNIRGAGPTAVVFIDLDNFKAVNDQHGHAAGDRCLEIVVSTIGAVVAHKGKLYRYGGDEFTVVLPNFTAPEAIATAQRIREEIEGAKPGGGNIKVTASIGVSASNIEDINRDQLIESADAAMYVSKSSNKNCVTVWVKGMKSTGR